MTSRKPCAAVPCPGGDSIFSPSERIASPSRFQKSSTAWPPGPPSFKALRGDFGCGRSFIARWYQQQALAAGFAVAEVQISENDTPLHRLETVDRRAMEALRTREWEVGAFRSLLSEWLLSLEDEVIDGGVSADDSTELARAIGRLLEGRLAEVSATQPRFAAALRAWQAAQVKEDYTVSEGLMAWLMAQPNVGARENRSSAWTSRPPSRIRPFAWCSSPHRRRLS